MSPRTYNMDKRREQIERSRRQVLVSARALLADPAGYTAFTLDSVARHAGVARGTVYYQFGSKAGLLEALCDDLGAIGGLADLPRAFTQADPAEALTWFIGCFALFWQADRAAMRRLRGLASLDPEVHEVIAARDQRRHDGLHVLVGRLLGDGADPASRERAERALLALTSFETFDVLAPDGQDLTEVAPEVTRLAFGVVGRAGGEVRPAPGAR